MENLLEVISITTFVIRLISRIPFFSSKFGTIFTGTQPLKVEWIPVLYFYKSQQGIMLSIFLSLKNSSKNDFNVSGEATITRRKCHLDSRFLTALLNGKRILTVKVEHKQTAEATIGFKHDPESYPDLLLQNISPGIYEIKLKLTDGKEKVTKVGLFAIDKSDIIKFKSVNAKLSFKIIE